MSKGLSLHIGLNFVNPDAYNGWDGALSGCINDANSMHAIAVSQGFQAEKLIDSQATASQVVSKISQIAGQLQAGDICLLTYSGHGGQLPDQTGQEEDGMDETWVLWDRELLDNELHCLWSRFPSGVRIFVSSDSCHSGTVVKMYFKQQQQQQQRTKQRGKVINIQDLKRVSDERLTQSRRIIASNGLRSAVQPTKEPKPRFIPIDVSLRSFEKKMDEYRYYGYMAGSKEQNPVSAQLIFISGCQDNQYSYDGDQNGLFTSKLLQVWANGGFSGSHLSFYNQISALMPSYQTPNYMTLGMPVEGFINQKPYSVQYAGAVVAGGDGQATPVSTSPRRPSITPPSDWERNNATPPTFQVDKGSNGYYYVELASDPQLFNYSTNGAQRTKQNFYGTWANDSGVSPRLTNATFQLPLATWNNLKNNGMLYCKVGSTSSSDPGQWEDHMVSLYEEDYNENAPHMEIVGAGVPQPTPSPEPGTGAPSTQGKKISASVGRGGTNRAEDVLTVQQLLNLVPFEDGGPEEPLEEDGKIGRMTIGAIEDYQGFMGIQQDGLISPTGPTFAALNARRAQVVAQSSRGKKTAAARKHEIVL
ncbi:MAG: caspase family protein [Chryseosolibacter sp.]